jgi:hypothetical protein
MLLAANMIATLNCYYFLNPGINFILTIGNAAKLAIPIFLGYIRYKDPIIKNKLNALLIRLKLRK